MYRYDEPEAYPAEFRNYVIVGGVCIALGLSFLFSIWASRTYQDGGAAEALRWEHHTYRDNWQLVTREDWQSSLRLTPVKMPVRGVGEVAGIDNIRNCYQKFHHTDRVYAGQSCSGSGKNRHCHSRYNHIPVYRPFCTYDTWDWIVVEDQLRTGDTTATEWGTVTPGPVDRQRRVGAYDVVIDYREEGDPVLYHYTLHPKTEGDFQSWRVGERVSVEVYNIGIVYDVIRVEHIAAATPAE
jgi:hypothetical protein